jgi:transposase
MYLRAHRRKKNGKEHRYFSVVESRRTAEGKTVQRPVLYLGEINDSQEAAWRKTVEVVGEAGNREEAISLFPDDRPVPADAVNGVQVRLGELELHRPRSFGDCWLAHRVWMDLRLDEFWGSRLGVRRGEVPWEKVLALLVINRLIDPGSEFRVHRQWFERSAMDELLGVSFAAAGKDRLYRCLDLLLPHREAVFKHLHGRWTDLFSAKFDVLLYDLTSTYFEGQCAEIPKARHGYSRDGRPDCRQVVIALVITTDGLPLAYEVMAGNASDRGSLKQIEERYGKARRVWVMDRGIPTEELLSEMRREGVQYLVGTPKGRLREVEQKLLSKSWQEVHDGVTVKLLEETGELLVLARSRPRRSKESAIRRKKLRRLIEGLRKLRAHPPGRDQLLERLGALKQAAGRAARLMEITVPAAGEPVNAKSFRYRLSRERFKAAKRLDGKYLLRTNVSGEGPVEAWRRYIQLTEIEAAFRCLKSDLAIRPVHHQVESRVEAHIFVAFLAYCLMATLKKRLEVLTPGLTPKAVLEKLATIQMIDVWLPTVDGRHLIMPRYTQPETDQQLLLDQMKLRLPSQPPPRIRTSQLPAPAPAENPSSCGADL